MSPSVVPCGEFTATTVTPSVDVAIDDHSLEGADVEVQDTPELILLYIEPGPAEPSPAYSILPFADEASADHAL